MTVKEPTCIATLSGGIDSTVMVHHLLKQGECPLCVYLDYGTVSKTAELRAAKATCTRLGLSLEVLPMPGYSKMVNAYILGNAEPDYDALFWLQGRNPIIALCLAAMASNRKLGRVYMGMNASDASEVYIDSDTRAISAINTLIQCTYHDPPTVVAPWLDLKLKKHEVILLGQTFKVNWTKETHSCSMGATKPCMDYYLCDSCFERRASFEEAKLPDPFFKGNQRV